MKIHLKYIYIGILVILAFWTGFNIYNGLHKISVETAAIDKQAENMENLVNESITACYKAYDDIKATQEEKDKLKVYEQNISQAPNSRVKAGIAMAMIDYSIMHITEATLDTITGDDDQFVDPSHNFALQNLTVIQRQLLDSQSTDMRENSNTDETENNKNQTASNTQEVTNAN